MEIVQYGRQEVGTEMIDIREKKYTVYNLYEMFLDGQLVFPFKPIALYSLQKKAQEAWLQPGGASGRRDRENTWDSGRCESGKTGSLHWLSEKAGSHREKKESGTCICSGRRSGQTSDRFSTCHYYR